MISNLPMGAENDPRAPYNQEDVPVNCTISVTISTTCSYDVPKHLTEEDEFDELNTFIKDDVSAWLSSEMPNWAVDDIAVIVD